MGSVVYHTSSIAVTVYLHLFDWAYFKTFLQTREIILNYLIPLFFFSPNPEKQ